MDVQCVGRTTFVNTLCGKKVLQSKDSDDATNAHLEEGVRIKPITVGAYLSGLYIPLLVVDLTYLDDRARA